MTETSEAEHRMQCAKGMQLLLIVNVAGLATAARSDWRTAYSRCGADSALSWED